MKKTILIRNKPLNKLNDLIHYNISNYDYPKLTDEIDYLVWYEPKINILQDDINSVLRMNNKVKIILFVPEIHFYLVKSLFPSCYIFDLSRGDSLLEIIDEIKSKEGFKYEKINFTEKEELFLSELAFGLSNKELCYQLMMSERSVRRMKEKLLSKTGLSSTQQLVIYALNKGY